MKPLTLLLLLSCCLSVFATYADNIHKLQDKTTYTIYDDALVLLHLGSSVYNQSDSLIEYNISMLTPFVPQVDYFSLLQVPGSGMMLQNQTLYANAEISISINGVYSPGRPYMDSNNPGYFVGSYTVLIYMSNGNVTSVQWNEDSCASCQPSQCIGGYNCGIAVSSADNCQKSTDCNIQVYLAWVGQDINGQSFSSAGYIPSQFSQYSIVPVYETAAGIYQGHYQPP